MNILTTINKIPHLFLFINFPNKGNSLAAQSVKERSTVWRSEDPEDYPGDMSYLEELEKYQFSVW